MDTAYDVIKELEPYKFVKQNSRVDTPINKLLA